MVHIWLTVIHTLMAVAASTSGAVQGSVSCSRTLQHADQGNRTSNLLITKRWLCPWTTAALTAAVIKLFVEKQDVWPHSSKRTNNWRTCYSLDWNPKYLQTSYFAIYCGGNRSFQPRRGTEKIECDILFKDNREYLDSGNSKIVQRQNILSLWGLKIFQNKMNQLFFSEERILRPVTHMWWGYMEE